MGDKMQTALIVVAMQNAFCHPEGSFKKRGYKIINLDQVIETNKKLIDYFHDKSWPIIYTRLAYKLDYSDAGLLLVKHPQIKQLNAYIRGSFDSAIFEYLYPLPEDVILNKTRYDPFVKTKLESILKQREINHIIVSGLLTNVCVESTIRSAFDRDFKVTLIPDATSTYSKELYESSIETIKRHFAEVCPFNELIKK
jgi:ureidoacrylate peracid hydrolase